MHLACYIAEARRPLPSQVALASCTMLERLEASQVLEITDNVVEAIAAGCQQLTHLCLDFYRRLTCDGWSAVANHAHRLSFLSVQNAGGINDQSVQALLHGCSQLRVFRLGPVCSVGMEVLARLKAKHPLVRVRTEAHHPKRGETRLQSADGV